MKVYHHNDLDGRCAAFWIKYFNKESKIEFIECNYNMEIPINKIDKNEEIWIVDFSFPIDLMRKVLDMTPNVIWIDHHKTAVDKYKDFTPTLKGLRKDGTAGCVLAYQFCSNNYIPEMVPEFTRLIGNYDVWNFKDGDDSDLFYTAMLGHDSNPEKGVWENLIDSPNFLIRIIKEGKIIKNWNKEWAKNYLKSWAFETEFEGYNCIAMNLAQCGSKYFDSVSDKYDIMLPFVFNGENYSVSLYSTKIDVSEIAKKYGGGGHRGAAGMTLNIDTFIKMFKKN
jgi:oligoribonuclease NrnB/cAMP/cGMP phosphodiesterase (DHH superfamily)